MRSSDVEHVHTLLLGHVDDFESVRRNKLSWATGGFAPGVRFIFKNIAVSRIHERSSPILEWDVFDIDPCTQCRTRFIAFLINDESAVALPYTLFTRDRS
jgi:hypothetical protein